MSRRLPGMHECAPRARVHEHNGPGHVRVPGYTIIVLVHVCSRLGAWTCASLECGCAGFVLQREARARDTLTFMARVTCAKMLGGRLNSSACNSAPRGVVVRACETGALHGPQARQVGSLGSKNS